MEWVMHLDDDGSLLTSESSKSFFSSTNIENLKNNLIVSQEKVGPLAPVDLQAKGIISEEEQENNQI